MKMVHRIGLMLAVAIMAATGVAVTGGVQAARGT
jgi:hypothetical protein